MKKLVRNLLGVAALTLMAAGCEKSETGGSPGSDGVSPQALAAFEQLYPGAENVQWNVKGDYAVATFYLAPNRAAASAANHSAWFENSGGAWSMTETDMSYEELPQEVKTAFLSGEYKDWRVEEVDRLSRSGDVEQTVYVIEVEKDGRELDLFYSAQGDLLRTVADAGDDYDYEDFIPAKPAESIEAWIASEYPASRIIDIDREAEGTEVELLDADRVKRELFFDQSNQWRYTKTELHRRQLPETVLAAWAASDYAESKGYSLDDADHYLTASEGEFYRLELESRHGDVKIKITPEGEVSLYEQPDAGGSVSTEVDAFIQSKYPGAVILEKDTDDGYLEVEIRHEGREKELLFNGAGEWLRTLWEVRYAELPEAVKSAVAASDYASWQFDGADFVQTPEGEWYAVELEDERTDREVTLRVTHTGEVLQ